MKRTAEWLALLMVIGLLLISASGMCEGQSSGLTLEERQDIAEKFAPMLHLHPDESFYPVAPDYAISRSTLKNIHVGDVTDSPTVAQLAMITDVNAGFYLDNRMGTIDDTGIEEDFLDSDSAYQPTVHARVTQGDHNGRSVYIVQYFFYYAFNNGPMNTHEGDWESILVACDMSMDPIFAAYSQHQIGEYAEWDLVEADGDHPQVYVALGSHANYYRAYEGVIGPSSDKCSGSGRTLDPRDYQMEVLSDNNPDQGWLDFAGNWGDYGDVDSGMVGERGPVGPKYQGDRWTDPLAWAYSLDEASEEMFSASWALANATMIIAGIMGLVLLLTIFTIYRRKKKQRTLGPRLLPFLYITGGNARSIAAILAIVAVLFGIFGYFLPWYSVTMDVSDGDYSTPGPVEILRTDGIHGLSFNRPEPGAGLVQIASLPIPFGLLMVFGVGIFILSMVGIARTRKFGWRLMGRAISVLVPAIVLILQVSLIGSIVPTYVPNAPPEVMDIIDTVSANPLQGSSTQMIGDYGTVTLVWGIGLGVIMFIIASTLFFVAAIILIADNSQYFPTGKDAEQQPFQQHGQPAYQAQQSGQYQPAPGYYPPPAYQQQAPPQPIFMRCQNCGYSASAMPGGQPFQCPGCGNWLYPPP